jgi:hypothetical protein
MHRNSGELWNCDDVQHNEKGFSLSLSFSQGSAAVTCLSMASFLNAMLIISQVIGGGGRGRGHIPREVSQSICPFEHHLSAMEIEVWFVVHEKKETDRKKQGSSFHIWRRVNNKTLFFCSIKIPPFFMSSMAALCRRKPLFSVNIQGFFRSLPKLIILALS